MGSMQAAPEGAAPPPWKLKRSELRKIHNSYALATEKEAALLTVPTEREKIWVPNDVRLKRAEHVELAKSVNAAFLEALVDDLPPDALESVWKTAVKPAAKPKSDGMDEDEAGAAVSRESGKRQEDVLVIKHYDGVKIGSQAYASMGSLLLHLFRDWSGHCEHVHRDVYAPIVDELLKRLPVQPGETPPSILIPGAGLGRLSYEIALKGYEVESNEYSGVFCTVADWLFNRCTTDHTIYPLAHVFSENRRASDQYLNVSVPSPLPGPVLRKAEPVVKMNMTAGDFVALYSPTSGAKGPAYRKFDCVVTCFFIDTGDDLIDYIQTIDGLLAEGGVWINLGPLNYKKELRLKLNWEELEKVWENLGYTFLSTTQVHTAYHMPAGVKLYTEQYDAIFSTAVKGAKK